jgi:hypothetical protein
VIREFGRVLAPGGVAVFRRRPGQPAPPRDRFRLVGNRRSTCRAASPKGASWKCTRSARGGHAPAGAGGSRCARSERYDVAGGLRELPLLRPAALKA